MISLVRLVVGIRPSTGTCRVTTTSHAEKPHFREAFRNTLQRPAKKGRESLGQSVDGGLGTVNLTAFPLPENTQLAINMNANA